MAIVTPGEIRDVLIGLVIAATPDLHTQDPFIAYREDATAAEDFEAWAEAKPTACLRHFSIMFRHEPLFPDVYDATTGLRTRQFFDCRMAWPARCNRYRDAKGKADTIAADQRKLISTIGPVGFPRNYADHRSLCTVLGPTTEFLVEGRAVSIGTLSLEIEYWRAL